MTSHHFFKNPFARWRHRFCFLAVLLVSIYVKSFTYLLTHSPTYLLTCALVFVVGGQFLRRSTRRIWWTIPRSWSTEQCCSSVQCRAVQRPMSSGSRTRSCWAWTPTLRWKDAIWRFGGRGSRTLPDTLAWRRMRLDNWDEASTSKF